MTKLQWMNKINFIPFRNNLYELMDYNISILDEENKTQIPLDVLFIVKGELYLKWFVCCFSSWLYYTNILDCKVHVVLDKSLLNNDIDLYDRMVKLGIDVILVEDEDLFVNNNDHRLCKYNPVFNNNFENDLIIIDVDVYVAQSFDMDRLLKFKDLSLIESSEPNYAYHFLLERFASSFKGGLQIGWNEFLVKIHRFIINYKNLSFEEFINKIFNPDYAWANAGFGKIPHKLYKNKNFIELCKFSKYELNMPSDEFVYFIYSNFFDENLEYLHCMWNGLGDCFQPLRHIHNNNKCILMQDLIRIMININPTICYWDFNYETIDMADKIDLSNSLRHFFHLDQNAILERCCQKNHREELYWKNRKLYDVKFDRINEYICLSFINKDETICKRIRLFNDLPLSTLIYLNVLIEEGDFNAFEIKVTSQDGHVYVENEII